MLKQIKKYFVLWQNSAELQVFEAATKADAMKAARLYRRQWEIDDDKPVKALNEAEAAAYEAERQAQENKGKEEQTMKNITLNQIAQFANIEIIDATPIASEQQDLFAAAPATVETTAAIVPEVLPPEQPTAAVIPAPLQDQPNNLPGALLDLDERTLQLLKRQANIAAALPGVKSLQLVGRWLWLEFTGQPTEDIRQQLKDNRWSWAPKKGKWTYHNPEEPRPGKHRFMTFEEIQDKHGAAAII